MKALAFPKPFLHDHPQVENVNRIDEQRLTFGHRAADRVTGLMGSWKFILIQSGILMVWITRSTRRRKPRFAPCWTIWSRRTARSRRSIAS